MIKQIIEKVKAFPRGKKIVVLGYDGLHKLTTDDLHSLVEHIEKLEAMLADTTEIQFGDTAFYRRSNGLFANSRSGGPEYATALEAYEALKESQP